MSKSSHLEDENNSFLYIPKVFFDGSFWNEDRAFSKAEAWLYLIATGCLNKNNNLRGHVNVSTRQLADRWQWMASKVADFLKFLEENELISISVNSVYTVISIIDYKKYLVELS